MWVGLICWICNDKSCNNIMLDRRVETIKMCIPAQISRQMVFAPGPEGLFKNLSVCGGGGGGGSIYRKEPYYTKCGEMTDGCW